MYALHLKKNGGKVSTFNNVDTISVSGARILITCEGKIYKYNPSEIYEIKFMPNMEFAKTFKEELEEVKNEFI